jgi:hypothetical protein
LWEDFTEANALSVNYTTGTYSLTDSLGVKYRNLNFTGFDGTVTNQSRTIYGNLTIPASGGTYTAGTATTTFSATSGTQIITTNGILLDFPITKGDFAGNMQLGSALTLGTTRIFTFNNGILNLNNFTLSAGSFTTANQTTTRQIQFGTGNITVTGTDGSLTALYILGTNFSYTGTPTVNFSNNPTSATITLNTNFTEANALAINVTAGTFTLNTAGSYLKSLNFTGFTGTWNGSIIRLYGNLTLVSGMTYSPGTVLFFNSSGTATLTSAGKTISSVQVSALGTVAFSGATTITGNLTFTEGTLQLPASTTTTIGGWSGPGATLKFLTSSIPGTQATISSVNNITVSYLSIKDSNATGGGTFDALDPTNVNAGNVTGWLIGPPVSSSNFFLIF